MLCCPHNKIVDPSRARSQPQRAVMQRPWVKDTEAEKQYGLYDLWRRKQLGAMDFLRGQYRLYGIVFLNALLKKDFLSAGYFARI